MCPDLSWARAIVDHVPSGVLVNYENSSQKRRGTGSTDILRARRHVSNVPLTDINYFEGLRASISLGVADWIKLTTDSRYVHESFFFRPEPCNDREVYFTCLLLNISVPHCGDLVRGRSTNEGTRRWQMSANGSRECIHAHDRSPLCGFGIRRRPSGWHDGVGGGSLMTPLLILLFGIHPATAVGTDLLYAAATKTGRSVAHGWARSIHWPAVIRLASGSIPASILTLFVLWQLDLNGESSRSLVNLVLCFALLLTAASLLFRKAIMQRYRWRFEQLDPGTTARATVLVGTALGVLVSISSVGAGAVGVTALLLLYPQLPMTRIVGSDIAHAVPLTLVAGIGHWATGAIDWHLLGVLLVGSLPGIVLGSYCAHRVPEAALRLVLAATLILVAGNLASQELHSSSSIIAAFAPSAAH